ncbi:MAG: 50S ribosomal protein L17 [Candidatus Sulcia muelleri]|uniref:50S ribosomal protein L17 n=1 Tax=Karelsulcia muelleri (strain GWSS) TaxID=444179 RepID=A8Z692_KARMG|nr:50S ribosomal subunit protein L17 [Candidatus Karelsulcia muelleri GWSS]EAT14053.1 50S ribosomal protein L17 [Candidatus Karelsulcia muelleri str. Hc (Homalodisca coagulata)]MCJ7422516.1 50S ribosomal protein L17 [Candidatus Karelsulcia muelleri]MCJ7468716.1 50S ribosomal protein L17 [Candidatus Karelsulcia muelleri]
MRHGKKNNHLGVKSSHRKSMLSNMAFSLIKNKRIMTTLAKAKALRNYIEPLLTKSKKNTIHYRRIIYKNFKNKQSVLEKISSKIYNRTGGYTRIIKTGFRVGDSSETAIIELVDYNNHYYKNYAAGSFKIPL